MFAYLFNSLVECKPDYLPTPPPSPSNSPQSPPPSPPSPSPRAPQPPGLGLHGVSIRTEAFLSPNSTSSPCFSISISSSTTSTCFSCSSSSTSWIGLGLRRGIYKNVGPRCHPTAASGLQSRFAPASLTLYSRLD